MAFTNSFIYLNINKGASEVGKINLLILQEYISK